MASKNNRNNKLSFVLLALSLAACSVVPIDETIADVADELMTEFVALAKSGSEVGQDWFDFAVKARTAGNPRLADRALDRAGTLKFSPIRLGLETARLRITANEPDAATSALQGIAQAGFAAVGVLTNDPLINSLAGHAEYDALIATMTEQAYPCQHQPEFRDFDFWIGEWDVAIASGAHAGRNVIKAIEKGCVLLEQWTSASGVSGMSINYLDKVTDEWVQIWNAEGGSQINIRGGMTDEGMRLVGQIHYIVAGTTAPFRGLWTPMPDGRVRQFFEQSNDGGETWVPWFEGFYSRTN